MPRRKPYTNVRKKNQIRVTHVRGMGDVVFKGFQCLNPECREYIFVRKDQIGEVFEIVCPKCELLFRSGEETRFYDYELVDLRNNSIIERGQFAILHDDYFSEAQEYKYCIICNTMKSLDFFDVYRGRKSGRQGECRLCKQIYNSIKNQTRLTDQHREAAQRRRLYIDFSGGGKIDSEAVFKRFGYKCFKCGKDLSKVKSAKERPLDHTLPAVYLWPLTTENATLLCPVHNGEKSGKWPSEYYTSEELKQLSVLTGIPLKDLKGKPFYNPDAIEQLKSPGYVDKLLTKYSGAMQEILQLRNRLLADIEFDLFAYSESVSPTWIKVADNEFKRTRKR